MNNGTMCTRSSVLRDGRDLWREIFAVGDGQSIRCQTVLVAALGMGVPVAAGMWLGRADAGFKIGLGAILLPGTNAAPASLSGDRDQPWVAVLPTMLTVTVARLIAGRPWMDAAMIAFLSIGALLSNFSRSLAIGAIRFGIYLVLGVGFLEGATSGRHDAALVFGLCALWNIALRSLLIERAPMPGKPIAAKRGPAFTQRWAHFRRTLRSPSGWQFPVRLAMGLTVASVIRHFWPYHHFYWVMLTVVSLTQRPIDHLPVKTVQRLFGTIAGVGIAWIIVSGVRDPLILATVACLLATLVPIARAYSYLLYAIAATPLILSVLDLGKPIEVALMTDRIIATIAGGAIVIAGNIAADRLLNRRVQVSGVH